MKIFLSYPMLERDFAVEIGETLRRGGHEVLDPAAEAFGVDLLAEVSAAIRNADLVVAIITTSNPNVFYELGIAAGAGVPTLVAAASEGSLPSDLLSVPYLLRSGDLVRDAREIARRAAEIAEPRSARLPDGESAESLLSKASRDPAILESITPQDFEELLARLFEERGFDVAAPREEHDWGVDFVVGSEERVAVEVKKVSKQGRVSAEAVRGLLSALALSGASLGLLVSSSGFTAGALAIAEGTRVALLTLEQLLADRSMSSVKRST